MTVREDSLRNPIVGKRDEKAADCLGTKNDITTYNNI
jgi:hypothetical protein